jgi:hypothetical protein
VSPYVEVDGQWALPAPVVKVHPADVNDSRVGRLPIGLGIAAAWPSRRSTIHFSTRLFSAYPGHSHLPSVSLPNRSRLGFSGRWWIVGRGR